MYIIAYIFYHNMVSNNPLNNNPLSTESSKVKEINDYNKSTDVQLNNSHLNTCNTPLPSFQSLIQSIQGDLNQNVPRDQIQSRQGAKGMSYDYLSTDYVIRRMNQIFGFHGWSHSVMESKFYQGDNDKNGNTRYEGYARIRVTVNLLKQDGIHEVYHEDFGYTRGAFSPDIAIKGACSDALKRTCRHFGEALGNSI